MHEAQKNTHTQRHTQTLCLSLFLSLSLSLAFLAGARCRSLLSRRPRWPKSGASKSKQSCIFSKALQKRHVSMLNSPKSIMSGNAKALQKARPSGLAWLHVDPLDLRTHWPAARGVAPSTGSEQKTLLNTSVPLLADQARASARWAERRLPEEYAQNAEPCQRDFDQAGKTGYHGISHDL